MTVPVQRNSMAVLQPPRSRFMITDILAGSGDGVVNGSSSDGRTPSPQGPRDLSLSQGAVSVGRHHHDDHDDHDHDHDSDSDDSCPLDNSSVCSNGEFKKKFD